MYAARATQFAKTITMACSVQKQPSQPSTNAPAPAAAATAATTTTAPLPAISSAGQSAAAISSSSNGVVAAPPLTPRPRGSVPNDAHQPPPPLEFQWPVMPVSTHTNNLRLNMMNQNPKDLHTARLMIDELRAKVRYQTEHILKWRKAYAMQIQQHYRYQKEKTDQMNALTSQLLLLESRLKRKQKQIASLLGHRELTIQRQQKIIDTLSSRLADHGLDAIEASYATELDSLNDSDSAVVLEDIDSDSSNMPFGTRRRSSGGGCSTGGFGGSAGSGGDGITIVRSISDAIETNLNKYGGVRRNNCFLRRPEILETVYSVEEDPEPTSDVAEKRDKFRNRSEKALSSSSTEGQIDNVSPAVAAAATTNGGPNHRQAEKTKECARVLPSSPKRQLSTSIPLPDYDAPPTYDGYTAYSVQVPQLHSNTNNNSNNSGHNVNSHTTAPPSSADAGAGLPERTAAKSQVTNYNRVMSNHRSVTKPKDVKYKRINKAKSKSLEELRGRLKNLVERGGAASGGAMEAGTGAGAPYAHGVMPQTAQSYA